MGNRDRGVVVEALSESFSTDNTTQMLDIPVAVSVFPDEMYRLLKVWDERVYSNLIYR